MSQRVTGDYKVLQKSSSLTRTSPDTFSCLSLHNKVTKGYRGLQRVTRGYSALQGVTAGYKALQGITKDYRKGVL